MATVDCLYATIKSFDSCGIEKPEAIAAGTILRMKIIKFSVEADRFVALGRSLMYQSNTN